MRRPLTKRQREIYDYLVRKAKNREVCPSLRELGERFDISSTNGVARHLEAMMKKGWIHVEPGKARSIQIVDIVNERKAKRKPPPGHKVPLLGQVAAGYGLLADENKEGDVVIDPDLFGDRDAFALRVRGDSMCDAGIHEGDLVLVRPQRYAKTGDIVVAMVGEEATVKEYVEKKRHIELRPANEAYEPIIIPKDAENFLLIGKLIGLMRRY